MRLYNITDQPAPGSKEASPRVLKRMGIVLEPGGFVDVPDGFPIGRISGWINGGMVTLYTRPKWYKEEQVRRRKSKKRAKK